MTQPAAFDIVSAEFHADPFPTLRRLREAGPLVRLKLPIIGEGWFATTHELSAAIMKDSERLVRQPEKAGRKFQAGMTWWMPRSIRVLADNMLGKDDPEHRRLRGLVDQAFQRRSIEAMNDDIARIADRLLDRMEARGDGDLVQDYARDIPLSVICRLLGLPEDDHERVKDWMGGVSKISSALGLVRAIPGIYRLISYLRGAIEDARSTRREGLIAGLVEAESAEGRLSDDELLSMIILLFGAGHETTTHLISGGSYMLLTEPEARQRLMADHALLPTAVEECLRQYAPVQMTKPRYAVADMELGGVTVRRGENVTPFLACANTDPAKFDDPERFDIARRPNPHLSFATGPHFCLGFQLARAEARIAYDRLFTRFPEARLAVSRSDIRWQRRVGMRSITSLPVRLKG